MEEMTTERISKEKTDISSYFWLIVLRNQNAQCGQNKNKKSTDIVRKKPIEWRDYYNYCIVKIKMSYCIW